MRWKNTPEPGSVIWKKRFAFFPKKLGTTSIWFEFYYLRGEYEVMYDVRCFTDASGNLQVSKTLLGGCFNTTEHLLDSKEVQEMLLQNSPVMKLLQK